MRLESKINLYKVPPYPSPYDCVQLSEIDPIQYTRFTESVGILTDINTYLATNPKFYYYKHEPGFYRRIHFIARWVILLFQAAGDRKKKLKAFLKHNLNLIPILEKEWESSKDINNLIKIINENGFYTLPLENDIKFIYLNKVTRYFISEKCWEEHKSINSWNRVTHEYFLRKSPLDEQTALKEKVINIYLSNSHGI